MKPVARLLPDMTQQPAMAASGPDSDQSETGVCLLCHGALRQVFASQKPISVTSDCRPFSSFSFIYQCVDCGHHQRKLDTETKRRIQDVYAHYALYQLSNGDDRAVSARLQVVLSRLLLQLPAHGRLLDYGCGNGAFLKLCAGQLPHWKLHGFDVQERMRTEVEAIPGLQRFHVGTLPEGEQFTCISLIHSLEHMEEPRLILQQIQQHLEPEGILLIQVPDAQEDLLDFMVYDHVSFFTSSRLCDFLSEFFPYVMVLTDKIRNELSILSSRVPFRDPSNLLQTRPVHILPDMERLRAIESHILSLRGPVAVMGAANDGTWVASLLGEQMAFFLDDNVDIQGKTHMGKPVFSPEAVSDRTPVYLPFDPRTRDAIRKRLHHLSFIDMP